MNLSTEPEVTTPAAPSQAAAASGNFRWIICGLLFFATGINYIDRQVLGILKPQISAELHWDQQDFANVVTAFQFAYAFGNVAGGRLMDWLGVKRGFPLAVFVWSIFATVHGFARSCRTRRLSGLSVRSWASAGSWLAYRASSRLRRSGTF